MQCIYATYTVYMQSTQCKYAVYITQCIYAVYICSVYMQCIYAIYAVYSSRYMTARLRVSKLSNECWQAQTAHSSNEHPSLYSLTWVAWTCVTVGTPAAKTGRLT